MQHARSKDHPDLKCWLHESKGIHMALWLSPEMDPFVSKPMTCPWRNLNILGNSLHQKGRRHKTRFHIFYRSWGPHVYIYFKYFATQLWPLPHYKVCPNNAPYRKEHKSFSISFSRTLNGKKMGQALLSPAWSSCIPKSAVNYLIGRQQNAFRKQEHQADFKNGINLLWMRV